MAIWAILGKLFLNDTKWELFPAIDFSKTLNNSAACPSVRRTFHFDHVVYVTNLLSLNILCRLGRIWGLQSGFFYGTRTTLKFFTILLSPNFVCQYVKSEFLNLFCLLWNKTLCAPYTSRFLQNTTYSAAFRITVIWLSMFWWG